MAQRAEKGPFLIAASYDLTISVTDLSNESAVAIKFGLQNAQANRIIGLSGSKFAVASNPFIFVYDRTAKTNKPILTFQTHQTNVTDLCTDGNRMYSCSEDLSWRVWEFNQQRPIAVNQTSCSLNTIGLFNISSSGEQSANPEQQNNIKLIATGNDRGQIEIWNEEGKQITQLRVSQSPIRSIAPVQNGKDGLGVVGCQDGIVVIIKVSVDPNNPTESITIKEVQRITAHPDSILTRVAASPDGKLFATASADSSAKVWRIETGELVAKLVDQNQTRWIWDVAFTPDSKRVCTGGTDKICRIWDSETGALLKPVEWHSKGVTCIAIIE